MAASISMVFEMRFDAECRNCFFGSADDDISIFGILIISRRDNQEGSGSNTLDNFSHIKPVDDIRNYFRHLDSCTAPHLAYVGTGRSTGATEGDPLIQSH